MAILRYHYEKVSRKVIILSILSKLPLPASTIWTIKSKPLRVIETNEHFWNHNKEYFLILRNEHNQRTFILPTLYRLKVTYPSTACDNKKLCK